MNYPFGEKGCARTPTREGMGLSAKVSHATVDTFCRSVPPPKHGSGALNSSSTDLFSPFLAGRPGPVSMYDTSMHLSGNLSQEKVHGENIFL
ncbi:hypothetical protein SCFA_110027 [anaerobic digester metagenome]|uniref:Uncharacterized protein n=1 Tax=anaerobic digester metagenome TaxID=1263854 RepID=A0A485LU97_9ZZZZ